MAAGKKLIVEVTPCRVLRAIVATVSGQMGIELTLTSGASALVMLSNYVTDNTVSIPYIKDTAAAYTMYAGESLSSVTFDSSTGGQVQYSVVMKGTLFDA